MIGAHSIVAHDDVSNCDASDRSLIFVAVAQNTIHNNIITQYCAFKQPHKTAIMIFFNKAASSLHLLTILLSLFTILNMSTVAALTNRLSGQRVLITGAGRGIGQAMAAICAKQGAAKVAIASRTESELMETMELMNVGTESSLHVTDLTNQEQVQDMVDSIVSKWGGIDILINNAGAAQRSKGPFEELESDDLVNILNLNVVAVHRVTSAVIKSKAMERGGRIINISSKAGKIGIPTMSFYVASKFALEGLTATMAVELKDRGITVNSISPGMVNTQSFPKPGGKAGVRTAGSIEDGLFALLDSHGVTGHYLHVDELDAARAQGWDDSAALKPINEATFLG